MNARVVSAIKITKVIHVTIIGRAAQMAKRIDRSIKITKAQSQNDQRITS